MTSNTQLSNKDRRYNLTIQGYGYLSGIREIQPKSGEPFLACNVHLMQGDDDDVKFLSLRCIIRGRYAKDIVRAYFTTPQGEVKSPPFDVEADMKLGGITAETFLYKSSHMKGQTGISIRSSLLSISTLKIGNTVIDVAPGSKVRTDIPELAGHVSDDSYGAVEQVRNGRDRKPPMVFDRSLMKSSRWMPSFASDLSDEFLENGSIKLDPNHARFEAQKNFLREQEFEYDPWINGWLRKNDLTKSSDKAINEIEFDLRQLDFQNTDDSLVWFEDKSDDVIDVFIDHASSWIHVGLVETRWDSDRGCITGPSSFMMTRVASWF